MAPRHQFACEQLCVNLPEMQAVDVQVPQDPSIPCHQGDPLSGADVLG